MKHTPAPWKAQQDCRSYKNEGIFDGNNPDPQGNQNAWGIYGGTRLAVLSEAAPWLSQEEINANARLMAAAPELLDALEIALRIIASESGGNWYPGMTDKYYAVQLTAEQANKICNAAREAIAKATA